MKKRNTVRRTGFLRENKGLTLIELVVTVAIIAIFSGIVLSVVGTSSNSFRMTSSTAKVQMKTQELLDTIQDLVIDANRSVYYTYGAAEGSVGTEIKNDIDGAEAGVTDMVSARSFYVCNAKELSETTELQQYDVLRWDPVSKQVQYSCVKVVVDKEEDSGSNQGEAAAFSAGEPMELAGSGEPGGGDGGSGSVEASEEETSYSVLAENVTSFRADTTKVEGQRIVRFRISMEERGKELTTLHTVNLRNQIQVMAPDGSFTGTPGQPISVRIINAPSELPAGKKYQMNAITTGDVRPGRIWTVDAEAAEKLGAKIDKDGILVVQKGGVVTVTVTVYSADGTRTASDSVQIKIIAEAIPTPTPSPSPTPTPALEKLEISGPTAVAALENGNSLDLSSYTVTGTVGDKTEDYAGKVEWQCAGNTFVQIKDGQIVIAPEAWTVEGGPGTFTLTASAGGIVSNTITVTIVRIRILAPEDGAEYMQNDTVSVEVEYYLGNVKSENYKLEADGTECENTFLVGEVGEKKITASGSELGVNVSDSVIIQVEKEPVYEIYGADFMAVWVVDGGKYTYNMSPKNSTASLQDRASMYWVEDENGDFVSCNNWSVSRDGWILTFTAIMDNGARLQKPVQIIDLSITAPTDAILLIKQEYECMAELNDSQVTHTGNAWEATGAGVMNGSRLSINTVGSSTELKVSTEIMISNKYVTDVPFRLTDSRTYYTGGNNDSGWNVIITTPLAGGIIYIPTDGKGIEKTYIEAKVENPGGAGNQTASATYQWSLYIPALNITMTNGGYDKNMPGSQFTFPEGYGQFKGDIEIKDWIFNEKGNVLTDVKSLPGILYVECVTSNGGKKLKTQTPVICVVREGSESGAGEYTVGFRGGVDTLQISNIQQIEITFYLEKRGQECYDAGTFSAELKWLDTGNVIEGVDLSLQSKQVNLKISEANKVDAQLGEKSDRTAQLIVRWDSADGRYHAQNSQIITIKK